MTPDEIRSGLALELFRGLKEITKDLELLRTQLLGDKYGTETWLALSEKLRAEERRKLTMLERLVTGEPPPETVWDKLRNT